MGDEADRQIDQIINGDPDFFYHDPMNKYYLGQWMTNTGEVLNIKDMETQHIRNALNFLKVRKQNFPKQKEFKAELRKRDKP